MSHSPLIVCEQTGKWALAWRKSLRATKVRIIETRSLAECLERLRETPMAAVSLQWRAEDAEKVCELLASWDEDFPAALPIVTADRRLAEVEALAREAGAAWFVTSTRQLPALAAVVERHMANQPQPMVNSQEQIWQKLPWSRDGRTS